MACLKRVNYFPGKLLSVEDLRAEQEYHREKHRRHNLLFHASGIVVGLKVSIDKDRHGSSVIVAPGHAVDGAGNDIALCAAVKLRLPEPGATVLVELHYTESPTDPVPAISGGAGEETQPSRVEEGGEVVLVTQSTSSLLKSGRTSLDSDGNLVLARLVRTRHGWRIDPRFRAPRTR